MIGKATLSEYESICHLYEIGIEHMHASGLDQWTYGVYPTDTMLLEDIEKGEMYVLKEEGVVEAAFVLSDAYDSEYDAVPWHFGIKPLFMHRLIVFPDSQGKGIGTQILLWIAKEGAGRGYDCLRLDTYSPNEKAVRLYERFGMHRAAEIALPFRPLPFICFEKPLTDACPLLPILMTPAFRYGEDTPWGGDKLKTVLNKDIPDPHTGESLEVSVLPSLNSADSQGAPLEALIAKYGEKLLGAEHEAPFPLLLKFIDAKEALSVQVHPNDDYAMANENGKLGKEEAWVVLQADEGSELIYGTEKGVTRDKLSRGTGIEPLLRRVAVRPYDVLFIPAGCVHAIGAGIMLYEIQQSSDLTYRFYDYDRTDKDGNKRELHHEKALAVCDTAFDLSPIPAPETPGVTRVLDTRRFMLDSVLLSGSLALPKPPAYALLTVLDDMILSYPFQSIQAQKGQTYFIPATCPPLTLKGEGRALIAMPPRKENQ